MEKKRTLNIEALNTIAKYCTFYTPSKGSYGSHFTKTVGKTIELGLKAVDVYFKSKGITEYKKGDIKEVFESFFQSLTLSILSDCDGQKMLNKVYKKINERENNKRVNDHNSNFSTNVYAAFKSVANSEDLLMILLTETYINEMRFNSDLYYYEKVISLLEREELEELAIILKDLTCDVIYEICNRVSLSDFYDQYNYITCNDFELSFYNSTTEFKTIDNANIDEFNTLMDFVCNNFHLVEEKKLKSENFKYLKSIFKTDFTEISENVEKALKEINLYCKKENDMLKRFDTSEKSEYISLFIRDIKKNKETTQEASYFDIAYDFIKKYIFTTLSTREYRESLRRKMRNNTLRISNL